MTAIEQMTDGLAVLRAEVAAALDRKRTGEEIAEEAARLAADFYAFVVAAWPLVIPTPMKQTWHIRTLCEHLADVYRRNILRLAVTIPPGYLKSSILSVFGPAWLWTWNPERRLVTSSHGFGLATRDARRSRVLMQTQWYRNRWPLDFARDENAATRYSNTMNGYRVVTHVGGGTGDRGSILSLDDPHNAQELHSDVMLQAAKDWHAETWASRLDDAVDERGVMVVIGQRISEKDLIGHLLSNDAEFGRWTHLCLPLEYEPKHPFVYPEQVQVNGHVVQGDIRKAAGELLAPSFMDEEIIGARTSELTAQVFAAQYQQRPAPAEGNLLKRALWRYYPHEWSFYAPSSQPQPQYELLPKFRAIVTSWDTSVKDRKHSDFVSGQVWGLPRDRPADRYLLRLYHQRAALNATIDAMLTYAEWVRVTWPDVAHYIVIENTANGPDAIAAVKAKVQGVVVWEAKGDKRQRAEAAQPALDGRNCVVPGYVNEEGTSYDGRTPTDVQEFIEELAVFDQGTHDDHVDGWSQMVNYTRKHHSAGQSRVSTPKGRKPRPAGLPGGAR